MYSVLIVSSDPIITDSDGKEKLFEEFGFSVDGIAGNGAHAIAMLKRGSYDLVIADAHLPGVNGLDMLESMRQLRINPLVVILSDGCDNPLVRRCFRLNVFDLLQTPLANEDLADMLQRASVMLRNARPVRRRDLEQHADKLFGMMIDAEKALPEIDAYLNEVAEQYSQGEAFVDAISGIYRLIGRRFDASFPWVLMLVPMGRMDFDESDDPGGAFLQRISEYAERIGVFRLSGMKATVNAVCRYLVENMPQNPSLGTTAKVFGMNKNSLSQQFVRQVGMSFRSYYGILKLEYAKHILLNSTYRVREISEFLGYQSVDYFTSLFRRYTGCTPTQYKKDRPAPEKWQRGIPQ